MNNVPITLQIECIERELRYRSHVYPRLIAKGRMTPAKAEREKDLMMAVLATLQGIEAGQRLI